MNNLRMRNIPLRPPQQLRHNLQSPIRVLFSNTKSSNTLSDLSSCFRINDGVTKRGLKLKAIKNLTQQGPLPVVDSSSPVSVNLTPILNQCEFHRVIHHAQQLHESVVILWMANWCRKCIYLKPKLEKLAADYHPRVKFYCIDVNNVPYQLVVQAGVTLWKDEKKQAEVIGGHKAYLVANEVREMIDDEGQP